MRCSTYAVSARPSFVRVLFSVTAVTIVAAIVAIVVICVRRDEPQTTALSAWALSKVRAQDRPADAAGDGADRCSSAAGFVPTLKATTSRPTTSRPSAPATGSSTAPSTTLKYPSYRPQQRPSASTESSATPRAFRIPAGLDPEPRRVYQQQYRLALPTTCSKDSARRRPATTWSSYISAYQPYVYAVAGFFMNRMSGWISAPYTWGGSSSPDLRGLDRVGGRCVIGFRAGTVSLTRVAITASPMVLFLGSALGANDVIAAALCLFEVGCAEPGLMVRPGCGPPGPLRRDDDPRPADRPRLAGPCCRAGGLARAAKTCCCVEASGQATDRHRGDCPRYRRRAHLR